jgi:hypothetical protein
VNVIDLDGLHLRTPELLTDFPLGASRFVQRAHGYDYTLVNGKGARRPRRADRRAPRPNGDGELTEGLEDQDPLSRTAGLHASAKEGAAHDEP